MHSADFHYMVARRKKALTEKIIPSNLCPQFVFEVCASQRTAKSSPAFLPPQTYIPYFEHGRLRRCQFQALVTMVSKEDSLGRHPNNFSALVGSATNIAGSPGRRGASLVSIAKPEIFSTVVTTSRTEAPRPVPKFAEKLSLPERRCCKAATCASARSETCT